MTTEERIAQLEENLDRIIYGIGGKDAPLIRHTNTHILIALELRALRLMLQDEIREAAWRITERSLREKWREPHRG